MNGSRCGRAFDGDEGQAGGAFRDPSLSLDGRRADRDGKMRIAVNWLEIEIVDPAGKITYRNSLLPIYRQ